MLNHCYVAAEFTSDSAALTGKIEGQGIDGVASAGFGGGSEAPGAGRASQPASGMNVSTCLAGACAAGSGGSAFSLFGATMARWTWAATSSDPP